MQTTPRRCQLGIDSFRRGTHPNSILISISFSAFLAEDLGAGGISDPLAYPKPLEEGPAVLSALFIVEVS